jgi:hypothetical protein
MCERIRWSIAKLQSTDCSYSRGCCSCGCCFHGSWCSLGCSSPVAAALVATALVAAAPVTAAPVSAGSAAAVAASPVDPPPLSATPVDVAPIADVLVPASLPVPAATWLLSCGCSSCACTFHSFYYYLHPMVGPHVAALPLGCCSHCLLYRDYSSCSFFLWLPFPRLLFLCLLLSLLLFLWLCTFGCCSRGCGCCSIVKSRINENRKISYLIDLNIEMPTTKENWERCEDLKSM